MKHVRSEDINWESAPEQHFTGSVWFGALSAEPELNALGVHFSPGARTDWHHHPEGQVLYVVSGAGKVQNTDGETVRISAGDVVHTPAGETHWHGSTGHTHMMHLSLTTGDDTQWLDDKVSDEDYAKE